jgi:hypothetical protein
MNYPIVPYSPMLPHLQALVGSAELADLWADESNWSSLSIRYADPNVDRLYADLPPAVGRPALRVMLHRIHPCEPGKALWHSHPWPSAVKLIDGTYEHASGFVDRLGLHTVVRSVLQSGTEYEMIDPLAWHYVRPLEGPVYSIMITGKPWPQHTAPKPVPQQPLTAEEFTELHNFFADVLMG